MVDEVGTATADADVEGVLGPSASDGALLAGIMKLMAPVSLEARRAHGRGCDHAGSVGVRFWVAGVGVVESGMEAS